MNIPDTLIDPTKDYYSILQVDNTSKPSEIKRSYKKLSMKHHPDRPKGDEDKMKAINNAYEILGDKDNRKYYDMIRAEFLAPQQWDFGTYQRQTPETEEVFENYQSKRLIDLLYESMIKFQEDFHIKLPREAFYDFQTAVSIVYEIWNELLTEQRVSYSFGGIKVSRKRLDNDDNLRRDF